MRAVARKILRRLVADSQLYLYTAGWTQDLDGERVVSVALFHAEIGREQHPRGKPIRANFLSREAEHPAPTAAAYPADVRAVLDQVREIGWDGRREGWLLPACGLERPNLVLATPTRLRAWAGAAPLYAAHVEQGAIAERLARALGVPAVPEAKQAAEAQWRDDTRFLLRSRWGDYVHIYTRDVATLVATLTTLHARSPQLGLSVAMIPANVVTSGDPPIAIVAPEHWSSHPDAIPHAGLRESDVVWTLPGADGPAIESYEFDADKPETLRRWISLRDGASLERRFPA